MESGNCCIALRVFWDHQIQTTTTLMMRLLRGKEIEWNENVLRIRINWNEKEECKWDFNI